MDKGGRGAISGADRTLFTGFQRATAAFAAVNLIFPFIMILGGMGFMIGTGGTALVSLVLGTGDREKANRYFSMMVCLTILLGTVLTVVGILFTRPMAAFLGATPEMMEDCVVYGRLVFLFIVTFMLQNVFQSFLIAAERPKLGLAATIGAGVTNMIIQTNPAGLRQRLLRVDEQHLHFHCQYDLQFSASALRR